MSARPEKILALQFKYFGDAVLLTPALRALRQHFSNGQLHLLVPGEIAPLFRHSPAIDRVWPMPRRRGRPLFGQTWPVIRALRRERFDRSVDFATNDRGAILSLLIGARRRLGFDDRGGFLGRRFCYTERVAAAAETQHESARLAHLLSGWGIATSSLEPEICADPALETAAEKLLPPDTIICHVASSRPKKEWPLACWIELYRLAASANRRLIFSTGIGPRERALLDELKRRDPAIPVLPPVPELELFLAVLKRAKLVIAGDTGPLHFAAALGVPTIALFGPSPALQWAPFGQKHRALTGNACPCNPDEPVCESTQPCMAGIAPGQVFAVLMKVVP